MSGPSRQLIQSFPPTPQGKKLAWLLAGDLTATLRSLGQAHHTKIEVARQPHVGYGVWAVTQPGEPPPRRFG